MTDRAARRAERRHGAKSVVMAELARPEYEAIIGTSVVILPVGSTEQHGPHLPLGADAIQVEEVAIRVAERVGAIVAPTLPYGYRSGARTGGGEIFSGTTSLSAEALTLAIRDILEALIRHGARRIVVLDGHFENNMFLGEAIHLALKASGRDDVKVLKLLWVDGIDEKTLQRSFPDGFPGWALEHAAHLETSTIAAIRPDLLRADKVRADGVDELPPYDVYPQPEGFVPASGVLSDPSRGSAEAGRSLIDSAVVGVAKIIGEQFGA